MGEGGPRLFVVDATGKYGKEDVSKIRFKIEQTGEMGMGFMRS